MTESWDPQSIVERCQTYAVDLVRRVALRELGQTPRIRWHRRLGAIVLRNAAKEQGDVVVGEEEEGPSSSLLAPKIILGTQALLAIYEGEPFGYWFEKPERRGEFAGLEGIHRLVLHELAHLVEWERGLGGRFGGHGPEYRAIRKELIEKYPFEDHDRGP